MANTLFAIFGADDAAALGKKISSHSSIVALPVVEGSWLIMAPTSTTTKELSDQLGITNGESGAAIVVRVESYFGRATSEVWEWISAKSGAELVAQS